MDKDFSTAKSKVRESFIPAWRRKSMSDLEKVKARKNEKALRGLIDFFEEMVSRHPLQYEHRKNESNRIALWSWWCIPECILLITERASAAEQGPISSAREAKVAEDNGSHNQEPQHEDPADSSKREPLETLLRRATLPLLEPVSVDDHSAQHLILPFDPDHLCGSWPPCP